MPKRLIVWFLCTLIVVLAGCSPSSQSTPQAQATSQPTLEATPQPTVMTEPTVQPTPTPPPQATITAVDPPKDWQWLELPHLTLALPPSWVVPVVEDRAEIDPTATEVPRFQLPAPQDPIHLTAFDVDPEQTDETGIVTTLRIEVQPETEPADLLQIADADAQQVSTTPEAGDLQRTPIRIDGTDAVRLRWPLQDKLTPEQPRTLVVERYIMVVDNTVYRFDFTTSAGQAETYRAAFDQVMASLRIQTNAEG
jgi:hypothetical protein